MKKIIFLLAILSFKTTQCMYYRGGKLKYDEVTLTNKSSLLLELSWSEVPAGIIKREIKPGETITVKLGQGEGYVRDTGARITYRPIPDNPSFKQDFLIDLPDTKSFVFTAVKLADIMNNIWVPGVFTPDASGKYTTFRYMNMGHAAEWDKVILEASKTKILKP